MDPITIGAISAGASQLLGDGMSWLSNLTQNRKSRQFSSEMYDRQYRDNIDFWRMQNEYNTPEKQMERLRDAGLNPNLVYGKGGSGVAGVAGSIKSPDVKSAQFTPTRFSGLSSLGTTYMNMLYDLEAKKLSNNNLAAQNSAILADTAMKIADTARKKYDLGRARRFENISYEALKEGVRKTANEADKVLTDREQSIALHAPNMQKAALDIVGMRIRNANSRLESKKLEQQYRLLRKDNTIKRLDIDLYEKGITKSDPWYFRILSRTIENSRSLYDRGFDYFKGK